MTVLALSLVLLSALLHAAWNLLLKRSGNKEAFVWGLLLGGAALLAPLGAALIVLYPIPAPGYWFALATSVVHVFYFTLLGRGYAQGDLSLVYPIARGIGPLLVPLLAVLTLGEKVAWPAACGIFLVIVGIFVVAWWGRVREILAAPSVLMRGGGIRYALLTGLTITVYSLLDKKAVEHVQPFLYMYLMTLGTALGLAPYILRKYGLALVVHEFRSNRWSILLAGVLVFVAYGLALTAFSLAQVSYIAPAREVGIVMGVLLGIIVLKESFARGRLVGSGLIIVGLIFIAWSP